jgi:hypothetical protein
MEVFAPPAGVRLSGGFSPSGTLSALAFLLTNAVLSGAAFSRQSEVVLIALYSPALDSTYFQTLNRILVAL